MTPEQIDAFATGLVKVHGFLDTHGPGLLAAVIAALGWWVVWRHHKRQARRRAVALEGIHRLEQYANHPGARRLLDDIHNQPREEDR